MKRIINNISVFAVLVMTTVSCSDFLEREPSEYATRGFYKSEEAIRDGAAGVYNYLNNQNLENGWGYNVPFTVFTDHFTAYALERNENTTIGAGTINPDLAQVRALWNRLYQWIARANSVIEGSREYIDGLSPLAKQYEAEVRVLRAFAYYYLIATWGDVPFFTAPVTIEQYHDSRTDRAVILDFILQDLDAAAGNLPWIATERGRVDRAVAYGLMARAALLGGSLNYGGKASSYFTAAAEAAQKVIGQRRLANNFDDLFNTTGQAKDDVRNELLFEIMYSRRGGNNNHGHAIGFGNGSRNTVQTSRHPAMLLADTYECIDGLRIDESPLYDPTQPQKNRDPRFTSTLWMHGDDITLNNGSLQRQIVEAYSDTTLFYDFAANAWVKRANFDINTAAHPAAWASFANSGSGYMWAKFTNETAEVLTATLQTCNVPIMRYAEVLLSYAEAKIELNQLDQSVYSAINEVRNRAGMLDVSADRIGNQQKMRQLVRRERKVELALEGLLFLDTRRWGISDLLNGQPSYGLPFSRVYQIEQWKQANPNHEQLVADWIRDNAGKTAENYYDVFVVVNGYSLCTPDMVPNFKKTERHDLNDIANYDAYKDKLKVRDLNRHWNDAYNLWPIPQIERLRNPNLSQNDGYQK